MLDDLRQTAEARHLTFGPDPATHNRNTLGGMIGNNSCGIHALMAGKVEENTHALEILTYDGAAHKGGTHSAMTARGIIAKGGRRGEIYAGLKRIRDRYGEQIRQRFPRIPRLVSGYPLHELLPENGFHVARALVGTEGTCVTVLQAKLRLVHSPPCARSWSSGTPTSTQPGTRSCSANLRADRARRTRHEHVHVHARQGHVDVRSRDASRWECVAHRRVRRRSKEEADAKARELMDAFQRRPGASDREAVRRSRHEEKLLWEIRESGLGATSKIPRLPDFCPGWEDSAVPPKDVGQYLRDFPQAARRTRVHRVALWSLRPGLRAH